jgi:hypothetical protein
VEKPGGTVVRFDRFFQGLVQWEQVDYLITGTIAAYAYPPEPEINSCVSLNLFDTINNKYVYRDYQYFSERARLPYDAIDTFIKTFVAAVSNNDIHESVNRPYIASQKLVK